MKIIKGAFFAAIVLTLIAAACLPVATAAPADASITVTDSLTNNVLADSGTTYTKAKTDARITAKAGVEYYILQAGYADVYYNGVLDEPEGSYFKPPYKPGAWVTTMGGSIGTSPKTLLSSANNWTVTVPFLKPGEVYELRIAAVRAGAEDVVFGHRFIGMGFNTEIVGSTAVSSAYLPDHAEGVFLLAIYKNNILVTVNSLDFNANPFDLKEFQIDLAKYPIGQYRYKAYYWGSNLAPLASAVDLNNE